MMLDFVFPVFSTTDDNIGMGFLADEFFITAAHVIASGQGHARWFYQGKPQELTTDNALLFRSDEDLAVFRSPAAQSPYHLSPELPAEDAHLTVLRVRMSDQKVLLPFDAELRSIMNQSIVCSVSPDLRQADSGSPLLIDHTIFGVLTGEHVYPQYLFISSPAILSTLKEAGINSKSYER